MSAMFSPRRAVLIEDAQFGIVLRLSGQIAVPCERGAAILAPQIVVGLEHVGSSHPAPQCRCPPPPPLPPLALRLWPLRPS